MQNSKIEWTDHTFNPWWGCQRVSPGCEHCYAETLAHRYNFKVWGPAKTTNRRMMSENYWKQPARWNKAAEAAGTRPRVFCASMADVFEEHAEVEEARERLRELIDDTPNLDWLLLTKRPENVMFMVGDWAYTHVGIPRNVWIGTSVEDQKRADERIPHLLKIPAKVRFLSCEPLLGPVDLGNVRGYPRWLVMDKLHWVIVGGESGPGARPMSADWARSLRDQCNAAGVAFHFKQWGEWLHFRRGPQEGPHGYFAGDGRTISVEELTSHPHEVTVVDGIIRLGKHNAGRLLDGRTWDQFPLMARAPQGEERS
jgi:protein gp37